MFVRSFPEENREAFISGLFTIQQGRGKKIEIVAFHPERIGDS